MKKVVLLCAGGASTGMFVKKLNQESEKKNLGYKFAAHGVAEAHTVAADANAVLLGPQVSYQLDKVRGDVPGVPVEAINMMDYGMMNVANVMKQVTRLAG